MKTIPRRVIEKSLKEKGFEIDEERDHRYYYFHYKGKKTVARTKISTGTGYRDYNIDLIKAIKRNLYLDSLKDVERLLICPMNEQEYSRILLKKSIISC